MFYISRANDKVFHNFILMCAAHFYEYGQGSYALKKIFKFKFFMLKHFKNCFLGNNDIATEFPNSKLE